MRKLALCLMVFAALVASLPASAQGIGSVTAEIHMSTGWTLVGTLDEWRGAVVEDEWTFIFGIGLVGGREQVQVRSSVPIALSVGGVETINVTIAELAQHEELLGARVRVDGEDGPDGALIVRGITVQE